MKKKEKWKRFLGVALAASMAVAAFPFSAFAGHTYEKNSLGAAQLFVNPEGENDPVLEVADDKIYPDLNNGSTKNYPYIQPITEAQRNGEEPIEIRTKADVVMPRLISGVLYQNLLDVSRTKFVIFMAVDKNMDIETMDFVFNSTFLKPDEDAMDGITVERIDNPFGGETYQSEHAIDMYWQLSGDIENLNTGLALPLQDYSGDGNDMLEEYFKNDSYLSYLEEYASEWASGFSPGSYVGNSWAANINFESISEANFLSEMNIYAIPVEMNWEEMLKEEAEGNISFYKDYEYTEGDEAKPEGGNIYAGFDYADWECPMTWNALPDGTGRDGIKLTVDASNVKNSPARVDVMGWEEMNSFDRFIPTLDDTFDLGSEADLDWYFGVDGMPLAGEIVGAIFNYQDNSQDGNPDNNDDGILELNFIGGGGSRIPTTIETGAIHVQYAVAAPGAITVQKTISGLTENDANKLPESLAVTITDQYGNPARDLEGNPVEAEIVSGDWVWNAETGLWTAEITVEGLRPTDDTYFWDYTYEVEVEGEEGIDGYNQTQAPAYGLKEDGETPSNENIVLENQYTLGRGEDGKITYDPAEGKKVSVTVSSAYESNGGTTDPDPGEEGFTLTYNANGGQGEDVADTHEAGAELTLKDNPFTYDGRRFTGWNTKADGSGTAYAAGDAFTMPESNVTLYAQWEEDSAPIDWDRPVSKTATNLNGDFLSDVTLSLPAAGYEQPADVVLAMDCTSLLEHFSGDILGNIMDMAEELLAKNIDLNVGVVAFGNEARTVSELTPVNTDNSASWAEGILNDIRENSDWYWSNSGTNIQLGIREARELLDNSDTGADAGHQYLVLITDGGGFWYCDDADIDGDGDTSESVNKLYRGEGFSGALGNMDGDGDVGATDRVTYFSQSEDFADFMETYGAQVEASIEPSYTKEQLNNPTDDMIGLTNAEINSDDYILNMERGTYLAARELEEAANNGCQIVTIGYPYNAGEGTSLYNIAQGFREWTDTIGSYYSGSNFDGAFTELTDELGQFVDAGSYVVDVMGSTAEYDFDFVNSLDDLTLTVGGVPVNGVEIEENTYGFGGRDGGYDYILTYYPNGGEMAAGEHFVWAINVPVTLDAPVTLTYSVRLRNPETDPGTYGRYDEDGSEGYDGLYTNNSAVLYPVATDGTEGEAVTFPQPTVSYTVSRPEDPEDPYVPQQPDPEEPSEPSEPDEEIPDPDTPQTSFPGEEPSAPDAVPGGPSGPSDEELPEEIPDDTIPQVEAPQTGRQAVSSLLLLAGAAVVLAITFHKKEQ